MGIVQKPRLEMFQHITDRCCALLWCKYPSVCRLVFPFTAYTRRKIYNNTAGVFFFFVLVLTRITRNMTLINMHLHTIFITHYSYIQMLEFDHFSVWMQCEGRGVENRSIDHISSVCLSRKRICFRSFSGYGSWGGSRDTSIHFFFVIDHQIINARFSTPLVCRLIYWMISCTI